MAKLHKHSVFLPKDSWYSAVEIWPIKGLFWQFHNSCIPEHKFQCVCSQFPAETRNYFNITCCMLPETTLRPAKTCKASPCRCRFLPSKQILPGPSKPNTRHKKICSTYFACLSIPNINLLLFSNYIRSNRFCVGQCVCMFLCIGICICICIPRCIWKWICICTRICIWKCMCICLKLYKYVYMYI